MKKELISVIAYLLYWNKLTDLLYCTELLIPISVLTFHSWPINLNTYHAAGVNRRQVKTFTKVSNMPTFWNLVTIIWNHHEKCIQISTNMPGICLEICEIPRIVRNKNDFESIMDGETNGRVQSKPKRKSKFPFKYVLIFSDLFNFRNWNLQKINPWLLEWWCQKLGGVRYLMLDWAPVKDQNRPFQK